jgi:ubiquinone/menaquinone biosynthesis C-methylase UbiE
MADVVKQKEASSRHFDRWAQTYEADATSRWLARLQEEARETLALRSEDRVLDVGCGTGAAVRKVAPIVERAAGVDLSSAMIRRARELAAGRPNVELEVADSEHLPFADGEFTAVLCTTSFHHYPNPERAVGEMARVLLPGGRVAIGDGCSDGLAARAFDWVLRTFQPSHVRMYRSRELEELLAGAGMAHQSTRWLLRGGYMIMAASKPPAPGP